MKKITSNLGLSSGDSHFLFRLKTLTNAESITKKWWVIIFPSTRLFLSSRPPSLNFRSGTVSTSLVCTILGPVWLGKRRKTRIQQPLAIKLLGQAQFQSKLEVSATTRKMMTWNQPELTMTVNLRSMWNPQDPTSSPCKTQGLPSVCSQWRTKTSMKTWQWWQRRGREAHWSRWQPERAAVWSRRRWESAIQTSWTIWES